MGVNKSFLTLLCFVLPLIIHAGKYSEDANAQKPRRNFDATLKKPFRINRLNAIWHKATKRLAGAELEEFHAELSVQDQLELNWKKQKADGLDEDGEHEAAVRGKFLSILRRYKLDDLMDHPDVNKIPQPRLKKDLSGGFQPLKLDRKLEKIWKKAQMAGFSKSELEKLEVELTHQQDKMNEFEILRNEINQIPREEGIAMNSVHRLKDDEFQRNKKSQLKKKLSEVKEGYRNLEEYLTTGPDEKQNSLTFTDPRVVDLWMTAQKANLSDIELASFKEELSHFEHKLKKHEYLKQELGVASDRKRGPEGSEKPGTDPDTFQRMEKKVHEYERRIKKHHTELKMRVADALKMRSDL